MNDDKFWDEWGRVVGFSLLLISSGWVLGSIGIAFFFGAGWGFMAMAIPFLIMGMLVMIDLFHKARKKGKENAKEL